MNCSSNHAQMHVNTSGCGIRRAGRAARQSTPRLLPTSPTSQVAARRCGEPPYGRAASESLAAARHAVATIRSKPAGDLIATMRSTCISLGLRQASVMQLGGKAVVIRRDGGAFVDKVLRASEAGTWLLGTAHKRRRVLLAYQAAQNHGQSVARARECDWVHTRMAQARVIRSGHSAWDVLYSIRCSSQVACCRVTRSRPIRRRHCVRAGAAAVIVVDDASDAPVSLGECDVRTRRMQTCPAPMAPASMLAPVRASSSWARKCPDTHH
jgi:hypothetical protein